MFPLGPGEQTKRIFTKQPDGCCGTGSSVVVTLTDARVIQHYQEHRCCGKGPAYDKMVFLSDISTVGQGVAGQAQCTSCNPLACLIGCCCGACCKGSPGFPVTFRGAFGHETFTFTPQDAMIALAEIPIAALPHKALGKKF